MLQRITELTVVEKHEKTVNILFFPLYFVMAFSEEQHQMKLIVGRDRVKCCDLDLFSKPVCFCLQRQILHEKGVQLCIILK